MKHPSDQFAADAAAGRRSSLAAIGGNTGKAIPVSTKKTWGLAKRCEK